MTRTAGTRVHRLAPARLCLSDYAIPDRCHLAGFLESFQHRCYFFGGHTAKVVRPRVANVICQRGDFLRGQIMGMEACGSCPGGYC